MLAVITDGNAILAGEFTQRQTGRAFLLYGVFIHPEGVVTQCGYCSFLSQIKNKICRFLTGRPASGGVIIYDICSSLSADAVKCRDAGLVNGCEGALLLLLEGLTRPYGTRPGFSVFCRVSIDESIPCRFGTSGMTRNWGESPQ